MIDEQPATMLVIRIATPEDIAAIEELDSFSQSPTRHIHREMEKYFGSVDPSTHERTLIFLAEVGDTPAGKAELMLPAASCGGVGYIKRVIVHPDFRGKGLAKQMLQHIIKFADTEQKLEAVDLHVWEGNLSAIHLYESLGFALQHRELYYRLPL
jgi:ribosomal protein S18 acetylase RimI-like enzyme